MTLIRRIQPYLIALILSYLTAGIGAAFTELGPWYFALKQPSWKPPDAAFGIIWSTIFTLSAISAALAWQHATERRARAWVWCLFLVNAALNIFWSVLYFKWQRPDWAMVEWGLLWLSVLALVVYFWPRQRLTAYLNLPYLVWVSLAGALNRATIELNGPFG